MLTHTTLKNLLLKARAYKSTDRGCMYVYVSTGGAISFRYDYRFNGRRETLTLGRYGRAGLTLAQARERLIEVKKAIADVVSPATAVINASSPNEVYRDFNCLTPSPHMPRRASPWPRSPHRISRSSSALPKRGIRGGDLRKLST